MCNGVPGSSLSPKCRPAPPAVDRTSTFLDLDLELDLDLDLDLDPELDLESSYETGVRQYETHPRSIFRDALSQVRVQRRAP